MESGLRFAALARLGERHSTRHRSAPNAKHQSQKFLR
jgi:hypothetical protein